MKVLIRYSFLFFLFLAGKKGFAQQAKELSNISNILIKEFAKANVQVKPSAIKLVLYNSQKDKKHSTDIKSDDAFYLKVSEGSIYIKSLSINGLYNGVYWYLHNLGYRYYFPGSNWHYIPRLATAFMPLEKTIVPSFSHRRIWYAYGTGSKKADSDYALWFQANLQGGEEVNAGHSYDGIVNRNKAVFHQHPEYFAQKVAKGGIPPNLKFEVSNEALVALVIQDAFNQIENRLEKTGALPSMLSMDPSDGGGFSTSPASLKIGGPSEQAFYLANRVASAVRKKYPSIKIGLYAYNLHAAPPKFALEPNIVVLVATAMNQSAYRTDELVELWKQKGAQVGIRDYFGVMAWDWDMPGQPKGSRLAYINQLKDYYKNGIRYYSAETNIGWISRGLGHYIAAQLLWDIKVDVEKIKAEFFRNMFGHSAMEIEQLFNEWQRYQQPVPLEGDLYRWYKMVEAAEKKESNSQIHKRIDAVKQYLHYVNLFRKWRENTSDENLVQLLNYAYRVQDDGIVASYPLFRRLANSAVSGKANMRFNDPKAVWKQNNKTVTKAEINQDFISDLKSLSQSEILDTKKLPDRFELKTINSKKIYGGGKTSLPIRLRGGHTVIFQIQEGSATINLSTGLIKAHQFKSLRLKIYPYNNGLEVGSMSPLLSETIQPKQPLKAVSLSTLKPGTYIAVIDDARNGFTMSFTGKIAYAIVVGGQNKIWTFGRNNLVFPINKEKQFSIQNEGVLTLQSPTGRIIDLQKQKGIFSIQVQKGEEGIWKVLRQSGTFQLQGVLPLVSADQEFLLHNEDRY